MNYPLAQHVDHEWTQVGQCVYCSCGELLYQGNVPKDKRAFAQLFDRLIAAVFKQSDAKRP